MRIIQLPPARSRRDSQRAWLWAKRKAQEQPHYNDHLESEAWKETRRQVLKKYKQCYCCGARGALDVHHLTYKNFGREKLKELRALCRACHHQVHYNQKTGDKIKFNEKNMRRRLEFLRQEYKLKPEMKEKIDLARETYQQDMSHLRSISKFG